MKVVIGGLALLVLAGCTRQESPDTDVMMQARELAQNTIIVDTHIDFPSRLYDEEGVDPENVSKETFDAIARASREGGDFTYAGARASGLNAAFMSVYIPSDLGVGEKAKKHAENLISVVNLLQKNSPDQVRVARSVADVEAAFKDGVIALPMGMENGSAVGDDLANVNYFYDLGIRYITLTHAKPNQICDSSYDTNKQWGGLSPFGRQVVERMNQLGIMVDISHVSDQSFYDALQVSKAPVIASHSSARHFTPDFERNMNDEMIKALADNGGVMMINFGSGFLVKQANQYSSKRKTAYQAYLRESDKEDTEDNNEVFKEKYRVEHPYPYASVADVADHIDHVVKVAGIDHVGIGSDFDGVGDSLPIGLKDVSAYTNLVAELLKRGYSKEDVKKILSGNLLRVWREVEQYSMNN